MYGRKQTLYDILELPRDARQTDIVRCYRRLMAEMQKETTAPNPRRAQLIGEAYEVLSDPQRRAAYDESLKGPSFLGVAGGDKPKRRWGMLVAGIALALGALYYFTLGNTPQPQRVAHYLSPKEVHTAASVSVGRVNRVEMSGARSNLGTAVVIEEGVMMAPCRGIDPGVQILVRIPPRDLPAQLRRMDERSGLCRLAVSGGGSWPLPMTALVPNVGDAIYAANLNALGEVVVSPGVVKKVVRAANGTSIEIVHTDAEGRMVLADTLALAARTKPRLIIDYATLTGACVYALSTRYSGVFGNRADLLERLTEAGRRSGERVWPFPMDADYDEPLKSDIADIKQCTVESEADHILAARFLSRFVPAAVPWIHVDLAAHSHKGGLAHVPGDVTGFGVTLTVQALLEHGLLEAAAAP